ncbi:polar amino acid transport system permease protein [Kineococcus xinjiangensis]|uniref:Polar amino acid transport system permease protein n=1 Tax=Kineococcus xinjiangensis TaxID=512762 RepID=A0A2S6IWK3_9ACTN|nr:amino acid ABC transporter permease [Kineococcus xinjiangensis]PPK98713.1 polar amino acid transport system permease protein [Kineococcus xinjiangensis]
MSAQPPVSADGQAGASAEERPGRIEAVPVRHPGRWVAVAVIAVLVAMFLHLLLTNPVFNWPFVFEAMNQRVVIEGFIYGTLLVTLGAMVVGVVGGVILAVMRLSPNPVLSGVSWVFTWFFRGIPRLVLLTFTGGIGALFATGLSIGVPFDFLLDRWFGTGELRLFTLSQTEINVLVGSIFGGIIGLGLSEAAYMAEIARAGILSVDRGQQEAAEALGMTRSQTMRRIVLPQAMRVIVPPTGNEVTAMLKDTSLLIGIPVTAELFFQLRNIGSTTYQLIPVFVAAILYYLAATSVLMVGQYFLEKRFGRGFGSRMAPKPKAAAGAGAGAATGGAK